MLRSLLRSTLRSIEMVARVHIWPKFIFSVCKFAIICQLMASINLQILSNFHIMKKYIRKVARTGKRSLSLVIPADIANELNIKEKQKLVITLARKTIIIKDWKKKHKK